MLSKLLQIICSILNTDRTSMYDTLPPPGLKSQLGVLGGWVIGEKVEGSRYEILLLYESLYRDCRHPMRVYRRNSHMR
jgi:hypothetical protein